MRVLLDTNILLDVLLKRDPWVELSSAVWQASDEGRIVGYVTACTIPDIFYIARRLTTLETARGAIQICLEAFDVCPVGLQILKQAARLPGTDFEDNIQIACADFLGLDALVTRNKADFEVALLPVMTPKELLVKINQ
jgi:predicted nucleic acid-binding protein